MTKPAAKNIPKKVTTSKNFTMEAFQQRAEEADAWLQSLAPSGQKLTPFEKNQTSVYRFERLEPKISPSKSEDQYRYTIFFKCPKTQDFETLLKDISSQIDDFFKTKPDPISEKLLSFTLNSLHAKIDIFLQGKKPYDYMDLLVETAYRKEISSLFKGGLPNEFKAPETPLKKIKDTLIEKLKNIEQRNISKAMAESSEIFARNEMFTYILSRFLRYDIIAPCSLASFEIENREIIGLGQLYMSGGLNGSQILKLDPPQRKAFVNKIKKESFDKCVLYTSLLFHTDMNMANLHFLMDGNITLMDNQSIMPQQNAFGIGGHPYRNWLLAFPQAQETMDQDLLHSITEWNEAEMINVAQQFYHANKQENKKVISAFGDRIKKIKAFCAESISSHIDLSPQELIFKMYPRYQIHWDAIKEKGYPLVAIASYAGHLSKDEINKMKVYNPNTSYPLESGLQANCDPFLSSTEASLFRDK